jgi:hypothetical protein
MEVNDYGYQSTGYFRGEDKEAEYDYNFTFKMNLKRKISLDEMHRFFEEKNIQDRDGPYKVILLEVGEGTDKKRVDLSKIQLIYVEGSSWYKSETRDFYCFKIFIIYEYEGKLYADSDYLAGSDENCSGGNDYRKEYTREEAKKFNPYLMSDA